MIRRRPGTQQVLNKMVVVIVSNNHGFRDRLLCYRQPPKLRGGYRSLQFGALLSNMDE